MKLLDSDHCIAILRGQLDLRDWVSADEVLATTTISVGELTHGAYKSHDPPQFIARVNLFLATVAILPFDTPSAHRFGWLKAHLEKAGMKLATADLQIAATALVNGVVLVTHNQKHFKRVPELSLEDWMV